MMKRRKVYVLGSDGSKQVYEDGKNYVIYGRLIIDKIYSYKRYWASKDAKKYIKKHPQHIFRIKTHKTAYHIRDYCDAE